MGLQAAHWDDLKIADLLIRAGANVNARTDLGITPLYLACQNASGAMVEKLLAAGADANAERPSKETVLMTCARTGNPRAVSALLAHDAKVNASETLHDQTALMWAVAQAHSEVAKLLIDHGADVRARSRVYREFVVRRMPGATETFQNNSGSWINRGGSTSLLLAARAGDIDSVRFLLAAGANVNDTAPDGNSALHIAAHSSHGALAALLLDNGANPNADGIGYTALHSAVLRSDLNLVKALLAHGANPNARLTKGTPIRRTDSDAFLPADFRGATPFLLAARFLDVAIMRVLGAAGSQTSIPMEDGTTPLMAITGVGWTNSMERRGPYLGLGADRPSDEEAGLEAAKLAIALGANVQASNQAGDTALHGAVSKGYTRIVQILADAGASLNVKNKKGETPLAISRRGDSITEAPIPAELAALLVKLGAKE
jgi:ankyrin repeat protein